MVLLSELHQQAILLLGLRAAGQRYDFLNGKMEQSVECEENS
jgi:hypothetical protein